MKSGFIVYGGREEDAALMLNNYENYVGGKTNLLVINLRHDILLSTSIQTRTENDAPKKVVQILMQSKNRSEKMNTN